MNESKSNTSTASFNREFIYTSPDSVLFHPEMRFLEFKIYSIIRSFMDTTGSAYPSNNWLANKCGVDRSSVIRALNRLVKLGFIKKITKNNHRYLVVNYTYCPEHLVTQTPPPSDLNATPPSDLNATQLDQTIITSKDIIRVKGQKPICSDNVPTSGRAEPDFRRSGSSTSGRAEHNNKKLNKEINNKEKGKPRPENQDTKKEQTDLISTEKVLDSVPPKRTEEEEVIDPDFKYQDTYYGLQTVGHSLCTTPPSGYNLTPAELNTFETFWNLYPRQDGNKERVRTQWFHDGCHLRAGEIIAKLKEQIKRDKTFVDGYAPSAHRYIMDKRFENTIYEGKKGNGRINHDDTSWADSDRRSPFETL
jgi:DNA-binding Lrp family transcriptional regulator